MELVAESVMKITAVIPIDGGSTLVNEGNTERFFQGLISFPIMHLRTPETLAGKPELCLKTEVR